LYNNIWENGVSLVIVQYTYIHTYTYIYICIIGTIAVLSEATEPRTRARLLAAATSESGSLLNAVPASSLGLRMDDDVVRIAVGLLLGAPCAALMLASFAAHQWIRRQFMASVASGVLDVNHVMLQLMMSSRELCHQPRSPPCWNPLASVGLTASDLMAGVTIAPWKSGRMLVWDVSCTDTFALSHLAQDVMEA